MYIKFLWWSVALRVLFNVDHINHMQAVYCNNSQLLVALFPEQPTRIYLMFTMLRVKMVCGVGEFVNDDVLLMHGDIHAHLQPLEIDVSVTGSSVLPEKSIDGSTSVSVR